METAGHRRRHDTRVPATWWRGQTLYPASGDFGALSMGQARHRATRSPNSSERSEPDREGGRSRRHGEMHPGRPKRFPGSSKTCRHFSATYPAGIAWASVEPFPRSEAVLWDKTCLMMPLKRNSNTAAHRTCAPPREARGGDGGRLYRLPDSNATRRGREHRWCFRSDDNFRRGTADIMRLKRPCHARGTLPKAPASPCHQSSKLNHRPQVARTIQPQGDQQGNGAWNRSATDRERKAMRSAAGIVG